MQDYRAMIRSTFELGSIRDAEVLFENCIKNAFPTFNFRRLELIEHSHRLFVLHMGIQVSVFLFAYIPPCPSSCFSPTPC